MSSPQKIAAEAFMKTMGTTAAQSAMAPVVNMVGNALGSYFGQRSHGPTGPSPQDITDKKGNVVGQTPTGFGGATRDYLYSLMTERGDRGYRTPEKAAKTTADPQGKPYGQKRPVEPTMLRDDKNRERYYSSYTKNSENPFLQGLFDNAETAASLGGYAAPIAGAAAVGLGVHFATKPRSDYALAVGGGMGPSTGNSNIDAARASAYYQQETAQMKFEHQMALQQMRQQAQTPGRQSGGGGMGGGDPRDVYNMAASIINAPTPIYE